MSNDAKRRPPVPGGPAIPGYVGDHGDGGAGGAKNLRWRFGYHLRRFDLATYNARTLRTDEKILKVEEEMDKESWNNIGLSEVRRKGSNSGRATRQLLLSHGWAGSNRGGTTTSQKTSVK